METTDQSKQVSVELIDGVFSNLVAIFGRKMGTVYEDADPDTVKSVWLHSLKVLSPDEIRRAMLRCRTLEWPPSLGQFLRFARPCLDPEIAYNLAVRGDVSDPIAYWTAVKVGAFDLGRMSWRELKEWWTEVHSDIVSMFMEGTLPGLPNSQNALPSSVVLEPFDPVVADERRAKAADDLSMILKKWGSAK